MSSSHRDHGLDQLRQPGDRRADANGAAGGDYDILFGSTHWQVERRLVDVSLSIAGSVPSDGDAIDTFGLNALAAGAKSLRKTGSLRATW